MVAARSRRDLLRVAGIGMVVGAPLLLEACGDDEGSPPVAPGPADVDVLNRMLELEQQTAIVYRTGLPLLRGSIRALGERFLAQEEEQARALADAVRRIGGTPARAGEPPGWPERRIQADVLTFADEIETLTVGGYVDAIPKLTDARARATAAAIMTAGAEHILVLRAELGPSALPSTFVTGQKR